jgi:hypothetical protein
MITSAAPLESFWEIIGPRQVTLDTFVLKPLIQDCTDSVILAGILIDSHSVLKCILEALSEVYTNFRWHPLPNKKDGSTFWAMFHSDDRNQSASHSKTNLELKRYERKLRAHKDQELREKCRTIAHDTSETKVQTTENS